MVLGFKPVISTINGPVIVSSWIFITPGSPTVGVVSVVEYTTPRSTIPI